MLERFGPATQDWFRGAFAAPTPAQVGAWEAISHGKHALVVAPTGSGKTLSAFLWAIDRVFHEKDAAPPADGRPSGDATTDAAASPTRILYISPLKALGVDVERNLRSPLVGIGQSARRLGIARARRHGRRALRRHDLERPAQARHRSARHPHHDARVALPDADEPGGRDAQGRAHRDRRRGARGRRDQARRAPRGEPRAARRARSTKPAQRIGLSATVRPIDEVARFLGGSAPVEIVAPRATKAFDIASSCRSTTCSIRRRRRAPTPARHRPDAADDAPVDEDWFGDGRRLAAAATSDRDDRVGVAARRGGDRRPHPAAPLHDRLLQLAAPRRAADRPAQRDLLRAARARPAGRRRSPRR